CNNMLAGRPVQLFTGDSAGAPAMARTKMQEFLERENIACLIGPLATAEALAIDDYIRDKQIPTLSVAAAEDMTQRKANPWFVRAPPRRNAAIPWATTPPRNSNTSAPP